MKIGIDARFWNETGVGRYIRNLIIQLQKIDSRNSYVLFVREKDQKEIQSIVKSRNFEIKVTNLPWHSISEQIKFPRIIQNEQVDLMHFPYFAVPISYSKPFIVTIHDLILHHYSTGESSTLPTLLYKTKLAAYKVIIKTAAKKAKKIIAVSHTTKKEIIDHLPVKESKVDVIYEGYSFTIRKEIKMTVNKPYFLHVGNVYPHKNPKVILQAFSQIADKSHMYFIGKEDYFMKKLKKYAEDNNLQKNVIFLHDVSDEKLQFLYKNTTAVIISSLMEGFGLPAIEAMSSKALVIASEIPSLKEVTGGNALYFNPHSATDLGVKMNVSLRGSKETKNIINNGEQFVKRYQWKKMAKETLKIYESCVSIR